MARIGSLEELKALIRGKPVLEIMFDLLQVPDYPTFVQVIHRAIDIVFRRLAENPELQKGRSEDELTIEIVNMLHSMSIDASHDNKVGGHVDIVIKGPNDYKWLAEAKKDDRGFPWLYEGFQQLNTRYSTGLPGQDCGGLVIYTEKPRVDQRMEGWQKFLAGAQPGIKFGQCPLYALAFLSEHTHDRTGRPFSVRHMPVSLYFEPKDKSGRRRNSPKRSRKL